MLCILVCGRAWMSTVRLTKAAHCLEMQGNHPPMDIIVYGGRRRQTWIIYSNRGVGGANYKTSGETCFSCSCNAMTKPWGDYRRGHAIWQNHLWTTLSYAFAHPNRRPLWRDVPSGGVLTYIPDVLHSKHLGKDPSFYGGAVYLLTHYKLPGASEDNRIHVFEMTKREYKQQLILDRYPKITPNMVKQSKAKLPLLKGKASRIKGFGQALAKVFEEPLDSHDPKHHLVLRGAEVFRSD